MTEFVHLHVHSQYSMLEGAIRVKELCKRTVELGMKAVAVTDHDNMHGAIDAHKYAKETGLKPIFGCELSFVAPGTKDKDIVNAQTFHLPLLARNKQGYKNLISLVSHAWLAAGDEGPRATLEQLHAHREGLIVMSGCLGGLLPQALLQHGERGAQEMIATLRDATEPGSLFLELQNHGLVEQPIVNRILARQARELGLPVVATNDAHYLRQDDAVAYKLLGCIASGRTLGEVDLTDHGSTQMYLKSADEMALAFSDYPDAITNTMAVLERCEKVDPTTKPMLPNFRDESGKVVENIDEYFRELGKEGLEKRFAHFRTIGKKVDEAKYRERLAIETEVINGMGFPGYFLIVQDFINWGKANGVPVGPGRGSGAGSLVAYSLGITDLDPIPYNLLFERFLNPERVSMPDFDVDFCMLKREKVIDYVKNKYGQQSVGQIATFQLLKSKSVVRDVGRALGMPLSEVDTIAKLVPDPVQGKSVKIDEAIEQEPRLKAMYEEGGSARELLDYAKKLENLNRHAGMHAAGVVISEGPLWHTVPIFKNSEGGYVTQYAKDEVEAAGLVKFDFLGLTTLTVIDIAVEIIRKRPDEVERVAKGGRPFDLSEIPIDVEGRDKEVDEKVKQTYALLQSGLTTGVFQLESQGMQKLFKDLQPDRFEDIVAAVALYRPGPLGTGMVEDFVARKRGRAKTEYPHKDLEDILQDTYGVITYQEQVMMIARRMGGYSLGGADLLRRAMGKKKAEEMAKQKSTFVEGALKLGYDQAKAVEIFDLLEYFAGYGFNKSHSAAYALITYQTAYLKTHFPVEFACGTLTSDLGKIDKLVGTIADSRSMGIRVLPPDINESVHRFAVLYDSKPSKHKGKTRVETDPWQPRIRIGLGGIKGVGDNAVDAILEARAQGGPFQDMFDLAARVDMRRVNKGVLEALVQSGAFDDTLKRTGASRSQGVAAIDSALEAGKGAARDRASGQLGLFGGVQVLRAHAGYPEVESWDSAEMLKRERSALGFYLSAHPMDRYVTEVKRLCGETVLASLHKMDHNTEVRVAGVIEGYRERPLKSGNGRMAFFTLEDRAGRIEVLVRARTYGELDERLDKSNKATLASTVFRDGDTVFLKGKVHVERRVDENGEVEEDPDAEPERKLVLTEVQRLADAIQSGARSFQLRLGTAQTSVKRLQALRTALAEHPGKCVVVALVQLPDGAEVTVSLPPALRVDASEALVSRVERIFGERVAEVR